MSNINIAAISGNLTRDPEVTWVSEEGDKAITKLGLASNRQRKDADGNYIEETTFTDIEVFGGFAVLVAKKLRKGDSATVTGFLKTSEWEKDGEKRSKLLLVASQIDSDGFFRPADENAEVAVGASSKPEAAEAAAPATPANDDIPF